jgi:hypothetical protein
VEELDAARGLDEVEIRRLRVRGEGRERQDRCGCAQPEAGSQSALPGSLRRSGC